MVRTRSSSSYRASARRLYRRRARSVSKCQGKGRTACYAKSGCKYVSKGTKRSFCRKVKNIRRRTRRH